MGRKHLVLFSGSSPSFLSPFTTSFLLSAKPVTLMSCAQSSWGRWAFQQGLCPSWYSSAFDVVSALTPREQTSGSGSPYPSSAFVKVITQHKSIHDEWRAPWCRSCFYTVWFLAALSMQEDDSATCRCFLYLKAAVENWREKATLVNG